jgi:hypothetical protein
MRSCPKGLMAGGLYMRLICGSITAGFLAGKSLRRIIGYAQR